MWVFYEKKREWWNKTELENQFWFGQPPELKGFGQDHKTFNMLSGIPLHDEK